MFLTRYDFYIKRHHKENYPPKNINSTQVNLIMLQLYGTGLRIPQQSTFRKHRGMSNTRGNTNEVSVGQNNRIFNSK